MRHPQTLIGADIHECIEKVARNEADPFNLWVFYVSQIHCLL